MLSAMHQSNKDPEYLKYCILGLLSSSSKQLRKWEKALKIAAYSCLTFKDKQYLE